MWKGGRAWNYWLKLGFVGYLWIIFNIVFLFTVSTRSLRAECIYCVHIEERVRKINLWSWEERHKLNKWTGWNRLSGIWRKLRWNSGNRRMVTYLYFVFFGWGREDLGQTYHRFKIEVKVWELFKQAWRNQCVYIENPWHLWI